MSDHSPQLIERHCGVAIVGGSAAGLAAAIQLGRQRRSAIVVDADEPRNAPAAHVHGYLSREGTAPSEITAVGREEARSYGGEVVSGRVSEVTRFDGDRFRVTLADGHNIVARRVLAATGLVDVLPEIEGLAEGWGRDVIHCPFCHGFEFRDRRVTQIVTDAMGLHTVALFRQLTSRLTVILHDELIAQSDKVDNLRASGVDVRVGTVQRILRGADGCVQAVELSNHDRIVTDAVVVGPRFRVRAEPFVQLGLQPVAHPSGLGDFVETDATGATVVPGLFAAGNVTDPSQQVLEAAANGSRVGAMISISLANEDVLTTTRPSANESDWDHRYEGEQIWSGNPNATLVNEIRGMVPGRALDVGAGEGGDALWLAQQGWNVTANDVSQRGLNRIGNEAERQGLHVECLHMDANALDAFGTTEFDLVTAHYASIPRTPDERGVRNLLDAVAPGGTLLIVSHDLDAMRESKDASAHHPLFDPNAYLRTDDFATALSDSRDWNIEVNETRPRPASAASHHIEDVVFRAQRRR
jgi:thioredoxin reductase